MEDLSVYLRRARARASPLSDRRGSGFPRALGRLWCVLRPRAAVGPRRGPRTMARALPPSPVTRAARGAPACALHECSRACCASHFEACAAPHKPWEALARGRARAAVLVERGGRDRGQLVQAGQVVRRRAVGDHRQRAAAQLVAAPAAAGVVRVVVGERGHRVDGVHLVAVCHILAPVLRAPHAPWHSVRALRRPYGTRQQTSFAVRARSGARSARAARAAALSAGVRPAPKSKTTHELCRVRRAQPLLCSEALSRSALGPQVGPMWRAATAGCWMQTPT